MDFSIRYADMTFRAKFSLIFLFSLMGNFCAAATSTGSGFFITTTGYIVTNFHVVENASSLVVRDHRGKTFAAKLVRVDMANDLAIIKIEGKFSALPLARSSSIRKGDSVFTLGFPNTQLQGLAIKLTEGTVSSTSGVMDEPNNFQISVPIQPGNSGGPLLNRGGAVVGIVVAKLSPAAAIKSGSSLPEAVNYAIKSNYLFELIDTDINVSEQIIASANKRKDASLSDVVAKVEPAVVLIISTRSERDRSAAIASNTPANPPVSPVHPPADERDPIASGQKAEKEGRFSDALMLYQQAAHQGNRAAQFLLGNMYLFGRGIKINDIEAVQWFRKSADQGYDRAQFNLGYMYSVGRGLAKDEVEAVRWYGKAAEQGNAAAQTQVGFMYEHGRGIGQDIAYAALWYRKSAEQGYADAQFKLAHLYETSYSLKLPNSNDEEITSWYRKAAENGNAEAQMRLAYRFELGIGVLKNAPEAVRWYRKASDQGIASAQARLAYMYYEGSGVTKDETEAIRWFRISAAKGDYNALGFLRAKGLN